MLATHVYNPDNTVFTGDIWYEYLITKLATYVYNQNK
jgi:hypothetical protein